MAAVSPLAPAGFPQLGPIAGATRRLRLWHPLYRPLRSDAGRAGAGQRDRRRFHPLADGGAPVVWCRECLAGGTVRAIVANSGNSSTFTGRVGKEVVEATAATAARLLECDPRQVFISSTGVIGEPPPADKIAGALPQIVPVLSADGWEVAARSILTTPIPFPRERPLRPLSTASRSASTGSPKGPV